VNDQLKFILYHSALSADSVCQKSVCCWPYWKAICTALHLFNNCTRISLSTWQKRWSFHFV